MKKQSSIYRRALACFLRLVRFDFDLFLKINVSPRNPFLSTNPGIKRKQRWHNVMIIILWK